MKSKGKKTTTQRPNPLKALIERTPQQSPRAQTRNVSGRLFMPRRGK